MRGSIITYDVIIFPYLTMYFGRSMRAFAGPDRFHIILTLVILTKCSLHGIVSSCFACVIFIFLTLSWLTFIKICAPNSTNNPYHVLLIIVNPGDWGSRFCYGGREVSMKYYHIIWGVVAYW